MWPERGTFAVIWANYSLASDRAKSVHGHVIDGPWNAVLRVSHGNKEQYRNDEFGIKPYRSYSDQQREDGALRSLNVPVEVALQCVNGIPIEGRYGDRIQYTLTDDRTMCVDMSVAERIHELAIQPGELFLVCKRQAKKGNSKTIYWVVERYGESQLERDLRRSLAIANDPKSPKDSSPSGPTITRAGSTEPACPPLSPFFELHESASGNGHNGYSSTSAHKSSPNGSEARPPDTQLAHALKTAIRAAVDAEQFAKELDFNIRFTTEDVRSMGITILIGMQQRAPR